MSKSSLTDLRARDLWVLKVNEQVCFFPNKQGTGNCTTWLTGTVSQLLDCGCSYIIIEPNGRVYRRNSTFETYLLLTTAHSRTVQQQRRMNSQKLTPFKTLPKMGESQNRWKPCHFRQTQQTLWLEPWSLINRTTIIHHIHHYLSTTHPDLLYVHLHHHSHPWKVQWNPMQRKSHPKAG